MNQSEKIAQGIFVRRYEEGKKGIRPLSPKEAFDNSDGFDASPERMKRLREMLKKSEIGRETLEFMKSNKTHIEFEVANCYGFFDPKKNYVALNPYFSDEDLAITFVHEMRHARQSTIMENSSAAMTPETLLKNGFLIEADACAAECMLAHQMMEQGDRSIFEAHQKTPYAPMSTAFEKEYAKSHDLDKARNAAFMKWYDLPVRETYTKEYIGFMKKIAAIDMIARGLKIENQGFFSKSVSTTEMAEKMCFNSDGKCYVENPKKLETPGKLNVSEKQAHQIAFAMKVFSRKGKRSIDELGLDNIYVRRGNFYSTVQKEMAEQQKKKEEQRQKRQNVLTAVHNAIKGKSGYSN